MSTKLKVILGAASGILVLMLGLLFLLNVVYEPEPEPLVYPDSALSDSIFVGQNNTYEANARLNQTHGFSTVPYYVDLPESKGATIGSGRVYQIRDDLYVYVTEFDDTTMVDDMSKYDKTVQMQDILASQFPQAILVNYIPEETQVTAEVSKKGFINGFSAQYLADSIGITDGARLMNAAILGYILDIEDKGFEGRHAFVSVGTTNMTNDSLYECSALLTAIMRTVRFDNGLYETLEKNLPSEEDMAEIETQADSEGTENEGDDVYEQYLMQYTEGAQIQVDVNWEMANPDAVLELFLPGGEEFCEPLYRSDTSAQFVLTNAPAGEYCLRIKNYEACGEIYDNLGGDEEYVDNGVDESLDSSDTEEVSDIDISEIGYIER